MIIGVKDYHTKDYSFTIGKGELVQEGKDCTIVAAGIMVAEAIEAAEVLASEGISVRIVNMASIKPIDKELLIESAKKTGAVVTAEEHTVLGGLGSAVAEVLSQNAPVPMRFVGIKDKFGTSGAPEVLLKAYHLTSGDIVGAVKDVIRK